MRKMLVCMMAGALAFAGCETGPENNSNDPKEKFHIYLAFGQSNMEGQNWNANGDINYSGSVPAEYKENIPSNFMVMASANSQNAAGRTKGQWSNAVPPLCRSSNGISPADYFGRTIAEEIDDPETKIGVIVVAIAGCRIDLFSKDTTVVDAYLEGLSAGDKSYMPAITAQYDNYPYQRLVDMAKSAQEEGVIKGIIMHQGESDAYNTAWAVKVKDVYDNLLKDLDIEPDSIPLLAGEAYMSGPNPTINRLPETIPNAHVISSDGCASGNDNVHFSYEGVKELGTRYGQKMLELVYSEK